jgi:Beta-propeller repeat
VFPGQTSAGRGDAFIAKYDGAGNQLWVREFGTPSFDTVYGLAVDKLGNLYLAGETEGTLPGQVAGGLRDLFVGKYDSAGNQLWIRQLGTSTDDAAFDVAVDGSGNACLGGFTRGAFAGQTSAGSFDALVARYDPSGNQLWIRQFGTQGGEGASRVVADVAGNTYLAGRTSGTFPGQSSSGFEDVFVTRFNKAGKQRWVRQFGTLGGDDVFGLAGHGRHSLYVTGLTTGTFSGQVSTGAVDAYLTRVTFGSNRLAWCRRPAHRLIRLILRR